MLSDVCCGHQGRRSSVIDAVGRPVVAAQHHLQPNQLHHPNKLHHAGGWWMHLHQLLQHQQLFHQQLLLHRHPLLRDLFQNKLAAAGAHMANTFVFIRPSMYRDVYRGDTVCGVAVWHLDPQAMGAGPCALCFHHFLLLFFGMIWLATEPLGFLL